MAFNTLTESDSPKPQPPHNAEFEAASDGVAPPSRSRLAGTRGILAGVGIGMAIAVGGMTLLSNSSKPAAPTTTIQEAPVAGQSVAVEMATLAFVPKTFSATGSVNAQDWAQVMPQATGVQIQQILVNEGDSVQTGQAIAILDSSVLRDQLNEAKAQLSSAQAQLSSAQAQLSSAQAQVASNRSIVQQKNAMLKQQRAVLAEAESNLRRYQGLRNDGVISSQDLESRTTSATTARESISVAQSNISSAQADVAKAQAGINQAQAGINQAQAGVDTAVTRIQQLETKIAQTTVRAPSSGILAKRNPDDQKAAVAKVGELTGSNPLFYIVRNGALQLQVNVPETLLSQVKVGESAKVTSDADKRISVQGRVRDIEPVINQQTRQAIVKIDLPESGLLKPGMFLRSEIVTQNVQAVVVSEKAVVSETDGRKIVYVLDGDQIAHAKPVETGDRSNGKIVITSGINPDERVIVAGAGFVKDGDRVTVTQK